MKGWFCADKIVESLSKLAGRQRLRPCYENCGLNIDIIKKYPSWKKYNLNCP
jgi:hypothetical protein